MGVLLYGKLAPTFATFEKVGKIANSCKIAQSISNSLEKYNDYLSVSNSVENLACNNISSLHQSHINNYFNSKRCLLGSHKKTHSIFSRNYTLYKNLNVQHTPRPVVDYSIIQFDYSKTVKIPDLVKHYYTSKTKINETFIDLKISEVISKINDVDTLTKDSFIDFSTSSERYQSLLERLGFFTDRMPGHVHNLFFESPQNDDEIEEWKKRKRQFLTSLLSKLLKLKKEILKSVKKYKINRRECFRKIYCFLFKNLDDTDSATLISITY